MITRSQSKQPNLENENEHEHEDISSGWIRMILSWKAFFGFLLLAGIVLRVQLSSYRIPENVGDANRSLGGTLVPQICGYKDDMTLFRGLWWEKERGETHTLNLLWEDEIMPNHRIYNIFYSIFRYIYYGRVQDHHVLYYRLPANNTFTDIEVYTENFNNQSSFSKIWADHRTHTWKWDLLSADGPPQMEANGTTRVRGSNFKVWVNTWNHMFSNRGPFYHEHNSYLRDSELSGEIVCLEKPTVWNAPLLTFFEHNLRCSNDYLSNSIYDQSCELYRE